MLYRQALDEVRKCLTEKSQRWHHIEQLCGFSISSNPGKELLLQTLFMDSGRGTVYVTRKSKWKNLPDIGKRKSLPDKSKKKNRPVKHIGKRNVLLRKRELVYGARNINEFFQCF